jgi:phosphatidylserine decarboxylase
MPVLLFIHKNYLKVTMFEFIINNLLWTQGFYIFGATVLAGLIGYCFFRPLFYLAVIFFLFSFYFFRNPDRVCPEALTDDTVLICPADGKIVDLQYDPHNGFEGFAHKVSIFLSPLDVHVNWTPMAGVVEEMRYRPGEFAMAWLPKSSTLNEANDLRIKDKHGNIILVRQIAGMIARRICWWVTPGQTVAAGEKYGMIRFGSRVDIFMPQEVTVAVDMEQRVYGGQTVLGRWNNGSQFETKNVKTQNN